jgi:hypothetical protein
MAALAEEFEFDAKSQSSSLGNFWFSVFSVFSVVQCSVVRLVWCDHLVPRISAV